MKLLHTADTHLGTKTHGRRDPDPGLSTWLLDVRRSLEAVVQKAIDTDVEPSHDPVIRTTFFETPARRFVDVRGAETPTERILDALRNRGLTDAIVRVRYHVEEEHVANVNQTRILSALEAADTIAASERTVELTGMEVDLEAELEAERSGSD